MATEKGRARTPGARELPTKDEALEAHREHPEGTHLTTDQGVGVTHTDDSLKAGPRGPTLLQDFHLREKITRFDHERIPERVVHARGAGAHGHFQAYDEALSKHTKAAFLTTPGRSTPVFVRFSTVVGSRGSADTVRDVRGFAVKFYTDEGNFDLVGNNMPVFFIQDGAKFPDLVHAVKPEPDREIPQASSAHDTFWDFVSLVPETTHMVLWVMSDRGIPRSYRMMEGFGVHTFRLVNDAGESVFVKFHWKPLLGVHSLAWEEAQLLAGKDADFHRRDLWEAIEAGAFPEWELGLQIVPETDALAYGFDMLDPTKLLPEELVPVQRVGKLVLDRNPDNYFAEVEQVAFCVSNVVPGIDFSNDPLMQARLFSYLDTQLTRLGGPNFAELPINRPRSPVHNHQQDGFGRQTISTGKANYHPNSVGDGQPALAPPERGFVPYPGAVDGHATRERSASFDDHFSQASLFYRSLSEPEREHVVDALRFELCKVQRPEIRERVLRVNLFPVDEELAHLVAESLGIALDAKAPKQRGKARSGATKPSAAELDARIRSGSLGGAAGKLAKSPALSQSHSPPNTIATRRIAALLSEGFSSRDLSTVRLELEAGGAVLEVISTRLGMVTAADGSSVEARHTFLTACSTSYDAVYVPGGNEHAETLAGLDAALDFLCEAGRHCKSIGATGDGVDVLLEADFVGLAGAKADGQKVLSSHGIVSTRAENAVAFSKAFTAAIAAHRHWDRPRS
ncbi:MAG: catalase [Planctomycetes bacterium]|nr:catalase [Planctomycetota bacterium]